MRVAITGASGLIGSAIVDRLRSQAAELVCLTRSSTRKTVEGCEQLTWDPQTGISDLRRLENLDAFIHLAGRSIAAKRWSPAEKQRLRDSRVAATSRLTEQLGQLRTPPRVFLSASAVGIYGDCGDQRVTEDSPIGKGFLCELARDWEAASSELANVNVRVVHARFGMVLSTDGGALKSMLPIFRWGLGGRLGHGQQYWSWIGIDDCGAALLFLLQQDAIAGAVNVVSPQPTTNREFTKELGRTLHRLTLIPAPAWALRLAMGEMADGLLLSSCRCVPKQLEQCGFKFSQPDLQSCLQSCLGATE